MKLRKLTKTLCVILILGLCSGATTSLRADIDLWPFLELTDKTTNVFYPIYYQEGQFLLILNFYVRTNNGKDHHFFWPFVKYSNGRFVRVVPFWFSQAKNDFIFIPFIWQDEKSTIWTIPPVYLKNNEDFKAVIPFYIRTKTDLFIFPDLFLSDNSQRQKAMIFPFYMNSDSKVENLNNEFWLMPYYHEYSDSKDYDFKALYPVFTTKKDKNVETTWCMNYYSKSDDQQKKQLLFPFYYREQSADNNERFLQILNYFSRTSKKKDFRSWGMLPFMLYDHSSDGENFWCMNYYSKSDDQQKKQLLFPFYYSEQSADNNERFLQVFSYFSRESKEKNTRSWGMLPFMVYDRNDDDTNFWCMNTFYHDTPESKGLMSLPFYNYTKSKTKDKLNNFYLFPFIHEWSNDGSHSEYVVPFLFDNLKEYNVTNDGSKQLTEQSLTVLNCNYSDDETETSYTAFPFYHFTKNKAKKNKSFWLMPFFRSWDEAGTYDQHFLLPFYASHRTETSSYFWAFNYYQSQTENKSSTVVFPFYGHSETVKCNGRTDDNMWILWPFYQRKKTIDENGNLLSRNNRFLCFSNKLDQYGKRTFSVFGKVITERMN